jgi:hypothetical protein
VRGRLEVDEKTAQEIARLNLSVALERDKNRFITTFPAPFKSQCTVINPISTRTFSKDKGV